MHKNQTFIDIQLVGDHTACLTPCMSHLCMCTYVASRGTSKECMETETKFTHLFLPSYSFHHQQNPKAK